MRLIRLCFFVLFIGLFGCRSTATVPTKNDLTTDTFDYSGRIEPLVSPVTLRYKEVPKFTFSMDASSQDIKELNVSFVGEGSQIGMLNSNGKPCLIWEFTLNKFGIEGKYIDMPIGTASLQVVSDNRGNIIDKKISSPLRQNLKHRNLKPEKRANAVAFLDSLEKMLNDLPSVFIQQLPLEPIMPGAQILKEGESWKIFVEEAHKNVTAKNWRIIHHEFNDRVVGMTTIHNRPSLFLKIFGEGSMANDDVGVAEGILDGYLLIDSTNALPTDLALRYSFNISNWAGDRSRTLSFTIRTRMSPL